MQISTIFTRAWQQKYLTPIERSTYKFALTVLLLIPNGALLGAVATVLNYLNTSLPGWAWLILAAVIQVVLTSIAKFVTAQGDGQVGAVIQSLDAGAATDIAALNARSVTTRAYMPPIKPMVSAPAPSPVPPRASAQEPPSA